MTIQRSRIGWLLLILLLLASCQPSELEDELSGRITLWHSWSAEETVVMEEALAQFEEIHPNVQIVSVALPEDQILEEFIEAGNDGLGPGLLIGRDGWIGELVNEGLIQPVSPDKVSTNLFNSRISRLRRSSSTEGWVFGLFSTPDRRILLNVVEVQPIGDVYRKSSKMSEWDIGVVLKLGYQPITLIR